MEYNIPFILGTGYTHYNMSFILGIQYTHYNIPFIRNTIYHSFLEYDIRIRVSDNKSQKTLETNLGCAKGCKSCLILMIVIAQPTTYNLIKTLYHNYCAYYTHVSEV